MKDYYEQIQNQEERSSNLKNKIDRETSPEDQKKNAAERILKLKSKEDK